MTDQSCLNHLLQPFSLHLVLKFNLRYNIFYLLNTGIISAFSLQGTNILTEGIYLPINRYTTARAAIQLYSRRKGWIP